MGTDTSTTMEEKIQKPNKKSKWKINKNLIMLKVTLFFLYGATSSLVPYLTIHMQSIGLTMEEIAMIYLALPFTTFVAPPVTGFLVDKFGKYKPVVIISFILTAALHHCLLLLPHQETPGVVPSGYIITHPRKGYVEVWWSPCPSRECPEDEELDVVLDMCVDHCLLKKKMAIAPFAGAADPGNTDDLSFHVKKKKNNDTMKGNSTQLFTLDMHPNLGEPIEQGGIDLESAEEDDNVIDLKKRFKEKLLRRSGVNVTELEDNDLRCGGLVSSANDMSTQQRLRNYSTDCIVQKCHFNTGGPEVCPPEYKKSDDKVFWIYFFVRFSASIMQTAGMTIMDPIALTMIEKYGGDFGKEKLFSSLGMAMFSPITGALIDWSSRRSGYTDYSAAFYTYDVLLVVAALAVYLMPLGTKLPADNIFRDLRNIFQMPHVVVFIIFLYILGNLWGFIESYLFFYLKDLGAPNYLLGITVTVGTVSSMPFLYGADNITRKVGHITVIIVAFFAHAARLVGYSLIESAWWCFPFEALESLSVHMMWVAAATYCAILAPKGLLATLIGVIGMAHFSIGRGSGSFVGGHVIAKFGIRQGFRVMGLVAVISGIIYALLHILWLRKVDKSDEDLKDDEPKFKDQGTMVSFERLSLVIEYNQIGSLTSLGRVREHGIITRARSNSMRRGSYSSGMFKVTKGSSSKVDLLKSAVEVNHHKSSSQMRISNNYLNRQANNSTGKIYPDIKSATPPELEIEALIPNEKDEIIYDTVKSKNNSENSSKANPV
ncbi:major facilitator superfamily domain-containing protein 6-A isoform X2 [Tenebrio molitor]|uniref:major facilitator superfamily domain-containing protein 6-A isoform X2 n=1 Tax=Tenebrio molitor TaxID=7067 RepID=UPI0036248297